MSYCSGILCLKLLQGQGAALSSLSIDNKRFWLSPAWEGVGRLLRVIYSTVAFSTCCVLGVGGFVAWVLTAPYFYMPELPETSALLQVRVSADKSLMSSTCGHCCSPVTSAVNHKTMWITSQVLTLTSFICNSASIGYSTQPVLVCSVLPKHLLPQYGVVFFCMRQMQNTAYNQWAVVLLYRPNTN